MFSNIKENIKMLEGAYRKLKSYYYYNKNFMLMRNKITEFESNPERMKDCFYRIAKSLSEPKSADSKKFIDDLLNSIDFYIFPKKIITENEEPNKPVSNTIQRNKTLNAVNFFIDACIEIHIIDCLWTVFAAKMDKDKHLLSYNVFGNTINMSALFPSDEEIHHEGRVLFNRYFNKYTDWRNKAFDALEKNYINQKDSVLISLDIKSYFYSVAFNFNDLTYFFNNHPLIPALKPITDILKQTYSLYYKKIVPFRKDIYNFNDDETPLPIGLFSSMILGNIYLKDLDKQFESIKSLSYYGRYVDDILIVINKKVINGETTEQILQDTLIKEDIITKTKDIYSFKNYPLLKVQSEKIKVIYIDHTESKAIIDIYNKNVRIIPSQMDPLPSTNLDLSSFDETAYNIDKLTKEYKIRDIGYGKIIPFKVGEFFSNLPYRYANINIDGSEIKSEIKTHIDQTKKFLSGIQNIEYYVHWLNYMYFLVITQQIEKLKDFITTTRDEIRNISLFNIDNSIFNDFEELNKKIIKSLKQHLKICLETALSLDIEAANNYFPEHKSNVIKIMHSNMFNHNFVSIPLANYLEYDEPISYCNIELTKIGKYSSNIEEDFKFIWSPRFIHYNELQLLVFYVQHKTKKSYRKEKLVKKFLKINHIKSKPFEINISKLSDSFNDYFIEKIEVPITYKKTPKNINIAVGSVDIIPENCFDEIDKGKNNSFEDKKILFDILHQSHNCFTTKERGTMLLVFPELYFPIYWITDLIRFAKNDQIGIVTGLQYLRGNDNQVYNYLATILPFRSGNNKYKNAFLHIREKNDYSPIEIEELAKHGYTCNNSKIANYQIFHWNGIRLTPVVCFELTDVKLRALLKGRSDVIAASVLNRDTTYFSNIIDTTVRDLHAFLVQANTSHYGDSRVTGPYDRNHKDIFKIKGGDNDHVVIGSIEFKKLKDYQANYNNKFQENIRKIFEERKQKKPNYPRTKRTKPDIKPFSARFRIK